MEYSHNLRLTQIIFDTIIMLYLGTKVMIRSPDGDTDFFDIVARVLQRD